MVEVFPTIQAGGRRSVALLTSFWGGSEKEGGEEGSDSFLTWVARGIVVVSILGALISWQASESSEDADDFNQQALREANFEEFARNEIRAWVTHDLSLLSELEESLKRKGLLTRELESGLGSRLLRVESLQELRLRQTLGQFFILPPVVGPKGNVGYDADYVSEYSETANPILQETRPEMAQASGRRANDRTVGYVRSAAMLATALFFLTLATLTGPALRRKMAVGGVLVATAAIVSYLVASTTGHG